MRDVKLIALWRKVAASARLSGRRRLEAIDNLARVDAVYFTSLEDAKQHATAPKRARMLVGRLLRRLANDERASAKARDLAVNRLAFIGGHTVSGLYRVADAAETVPMTALESIAAEIQLLKNNGGTGGT
jgi:hypothetical protein